MRDAYFTTKHNTQFIATLTGTFVVLAACLAWATPSRASAIVDLPLYATVKGYSHTPQLRVRARENSSGGITFAINNIGGGSITDIYFERQLFKTLKRGSTADIKLKSSQGTQFVIKNNLSGKAKDKLPDNPQSHKAIDWKTSRLSVHSVGNSRRKRAHNGLLKRKELLHIIIPKKDSVSFDAVEAALLDPSGAIAWTARAKSGGKASGSAAGITIPVVPAPAIASQVLVAGLFLMTRRRRAR